LLHPQVLIYLVVGALILSAFIFVEANTSAPMMPLSLFKSRTFSGANLLTLLLYAALGGVFFFVPFNLIQVQGYSATAAGTVFLPFILIMFFLSRWSGGLVSQYCSVKDICRLGGGFAEPNSRPENVGFLHPTYELFDF
jgi:hypothetical protein